MLGKIPVKIVHLNWLNWSDVFPVTTPRLYEDMKMLVLKVSFLVQLGSQILYWQIVFLWLMTQTASSQEVIGLFYIFVLFLLASLFIFLWILFFWFNQGIFYSISPFYYKKSINGTSDLSNPYVHNTFTLLLIK